MQQTTNLDEMGRYLEEGRPFYLEMLRQMVAINSFTANAAGVNELGRLTAERFAELGFSAETVPSANPQYGDHLVLTRSGRSGPKIGLVSHLDTVFPRAEEMQNDFAWRVEGDRIYGPGTVDIKGGTVVMYMVLDAIRQFAPDVYDEVTWVLLFDASEEVIGADFGALCRRKLDGDTLACLVFEGGRCNEDECWAVVARKGMAIYRVTVEGKASHAGSAHQDGANAVVQMADIVGQIAGFTDYERQLTFNVGTMAGGTVTNRVPHFASAHVEMRAFDADVYAEAMAKMLALNDYVSVRAAGDGYPCRVRVEVVQQTPAWPRNPATDRLFANWQAAGQAMGVRVVEEERGGLSDGNQIWDRVPTLDGLGPAGGNAHCSERSEDGSKDQEYVRASSLPKRALLNVLGILRLVAGG